MNIRDFIQRKKEQHFVYRDADKLAVQKANLERERKELEVRSKLQADVRKEQSTIRDLKREPLKRSLDGIGQTFRNLKTTSERANKSFSQFSGPSIKGPLTPDKNPFGPDKKEPGVKNPKARTVVVRIE